MGVTRQLFQLQAIELDIESKEQALAESLAGLGESRVLLKAREDLSVGERSLEELNKKQHDVEWQIEDIDSKLQTAQEALYSGRISSPKELSSLQHEVESFKNKRIGLEDKALEIMEQAEAGTGTLTGLRRRLDEAEKNWRHHQQQLVETIEGLKAALSGLKKEQQQALAGIDCETAERYLQLRRKKGTAVARVEQGICRGCGISLSTAELQRVRGNRIVACNSCGRILFVD